MLNLTVFSQDVTVLPSKNVPIPVLKLIVKDSLSGDSAKAQLNLTEKQLKDTKELVRLKDSVINRYILKDSTHSVVMGLEKDKFKILEATTNKLEKEVKRERFKRKLFQTLTLISATAAGILFLTN
jgi:hypothetical protein